MKTTALLVIATLFLTVAGISQTGFGLRAGVNFQNLNGKDDEGDKLNNDLKVGFHAGVTADVAVAPEFYIQPGLLFSTKGAKIEGSDAKINLSYVEVPINFLYKPVLGTGRMLLGFGPYVGFAVGGKVKSDNGDADIEFENEITPTQAVSGTPYVKRFDAGANLLFGYEFSSKISAQLNAQLGLLDISPKISGMDDDASIKNTGFGVSLGYRL
jgi:Outer membrane protein beta-barrel domain